MGIVEVLLEHGAPRYEGFDEEWRRITAPDVKEPVIKFAGSKALRVKLEEEVLKASSIGEHAMLCGACHEDSGDLKLPILRSTLKGLVASHVLTVCGHLFHRKCLKKWVSLSKEAGDANHQCPMCRDTGLVGESAEGVASQETPVPSPKASEASASQ